jgi:hypothetical protein
MDEVIGKLVGNWLARRSAQRETQASYSAAKMYYVSDRSEVGVAASSLGDFIQASREVPLNPMVDYTPRSTTLQEGYNGQWRGGSQQYSANSYGQKPGSIATRAGQHHVDDGYFTPFHQQKDKKSQQPNWKIDLPVRIGTPAWSRDVAR